MVCDNHAFDIEEMYGSLGIVQLQKYAQETGIVRCTNLDVQHFLPRIRGRVLEVGCGYGRIGLDMIERGIDYWGIDIHEPYVRAFRTIVPADRVLFGDFLTYQFTNTFDTILFPWSVIGDFSSPTGQMSALTKARELLNPPGNILLDIPVDVVNTVSAYKPGLFNVHEAYDMGELDFTVDTQRYRTYTDRTREIIELSFDTF